MKTKIIKFVIIIAIIALLGWGLYELLNNMAFSFATMLVVALFLILLLYYFHMENVPKEDYDNRRRWFSIAVVGSFGCVAIFAMSNYFYPSQEVFSNNEHHAIAVEGIETRQQSLLLAADSKTAFFDDHTMAGTIELCDVSTGDSTASLRIRGAGMPVYRIQNIGRNNYYVALDGQDNIHSWRPEDQLELLNENREVVASLKVAYSSERNWKRFRRVWHSDFILDYIGNDGNHHTDTSTYHGLIRRCYSLASLFPGVGTLHGVDFSKIELLRPKARLGNSSDDDEELSQSPFLVGFASQSGLGFVKSGNSSTSMDELSNIVVKLDGKTSYTIGLFNSIPDFKLATDNEGVVTLRYRMPMYRSLNTEGYKKGENGYYTFMIASTLVDENGMVNSQIPQNVLLYDVFDYNDNVFQMQPQFFSFQRGNTREPLNVSVLDNNNGLNTDIKAGERLPDIATAVPETHWIISLCNFNAPPASLKLFGIDIPSFKMPLSFIFMAYMLLLTILCCCSLGVNRKNYHSYIEPIAYIALLALLAIRFTLHWRAYVFPPTSGIKLEEFIKWRTVGGITLEIALCCLVLVFLVWFNKKHDFTLPKKMRRSTGRYAVLNNILARLTLDYWFGKTNAAYPAFDRVQENETMHTLLWPQGKKAFWIFVELGLYIVILILGLASRKPFVCIGLPVILYFVTDFTINLQVGSCWTDRGNSYAFFWQGLINMISATVVMFVLDGGYGLLFFVFVMLSFILRLIDLYGSHGKRGVRLWGVIILTVFVILFIANLRSIAIWFYTRGIGFSIIAGLFVSLFVAVLIWTVGGWQRFAKWNVLFVVAAFILTVLAGWGLKSPSVADSHIANRIMVLAENPSDVLGRASTSHDMTRFLEASLNDWVLEEYDQRGEEVASLLGERGHGYFKVQPHNNVGVSWMTQMTDLSVPRFIIAEQSNKVPVLLILLFFVMELVSLFFPSDRRWTKSLLTQIPLLLTVQSLLVWMAVTRRFVFLGQDFPMISLISRVNLYITVLGLIVWILAAVVENHWMRYELDNYNEYNIRKKEDIQGLVEGKTKEGKMYRFLYGFGWFSTGALLVALGLIILRHPQRRYEDHTYDVAECVEATNTLIADPNANSVEYLFREYQENRIKESDAPIHDISMVGTPQQILRDFCRFYGYNPDAIDSNDNAITRIFEQNADYGIFAKAAFDDFLKHKVNNNDIDELIYIVKRRFANPQNNKVENVRYTFGITQRYFRQQMPRRIDKSWRGSITAATAWNENTARQSQEGNLKVYTIPSSWTKDKQPAVIVKPKIEQYSVVGKYEPRQLSRNESYYLSEGEVLAGRNAPNLSKYGNGNYLAKNVYINSHPQFIYPLQSDFYWARPLAEQIRAYMNREMDASGNRSKFEEIRMSNSEVTLSIEMTRNLVHAIDGVTKKGNVAVVVADGEGRVRALVDHRKPRYIINPNDGRRIQFVEDSLKREGMLNRGNEAERFFGNKAILSLNFGPGSSQKPIVWTAVTTQYMGWDWNKLQMAKINNELMHKGGNKYHAWSFAGQRIDPRNKVSENNRSMFRSIKGDEGGGAENVNLQAYMRKSSNYYNAIMVYLGSRTKEELESGKPGNRNNPLLKTVGTSWLTNNREDQISTYCDSLFPIINYDGHLYSFSQPLKPGDIKDESILTQGLAINFDFPCAFVKDRSSNLHKSLQKGHRGIANYYAFPENSYFNNAGRLGERGLSFEVAREGIKSTAIGQKTVWLVSPLKMAEMYGKMVSFNRNYRLSIDPNAELLPYQAFSTEKGEEDYLKMRNKQFIPGLSDVFKEVGGTAHSVYSNIANKLGDYYIYGKTGTIDGKVHGRSEEDHLLAVIITNKDLTQLNDVRDYQDLLFYVIYIADFDYHHDGFSWETTDAAIINTVLESNEFKKYMGGK